MNLNELRQKYEQGQWQRGGNDHRNLLAVLAELEQTPLVPWIERVLLNPDDGPRRRELVDVVKQLETWQLVDVKRKGRKGSKWKQYRFHSRAQYFIDVFPKWTGAAPLHDMPTLTRHCPQVEPIGDMPWNVTSLPFGVEQGEWCWHQHDPPMPLFLRRVIGLASKGDPITVYAYGFPHSELMKDNAVHIFGLWEIGMEPFESAHALKEACPRARAFTTCNMIF